MVVMAELHRRSERIEVALIGMDVLIYWRLVVRYFDRNRRRFLAVFAQCDGNGIQF